MMVNDYTKTFVLKTDDRQFTFATYRLIKVAQYYLFVWGVTVLKSNF